MTTVSLSAVKDYLNVTHDHDDLKILSMLKASEDEALQFMNRTVFGSVCEDDESFDAETATIPDVVVMAVYLLVATKYDAAPDQIEILRNSAESLMMPYRCGMGM